MRAVGRWMVWAAIATPGVAQAGEESPRRFQREDVFELEVAADPQLSPDGRVVVYERRSNDVMSDRARASLWTVDVVDGDHRPLVTGRDGYGTPRWSPDGGRLAYLVSGEGGTQVHVRWMDSGQSAAITRVTESPSELAWSPDGRWIAFIMSVPASTEPLVKPPARPEGAEWAESARVIESVRYRFDGRGFLEPAYTHVFVVPVEGGTPRQLTEGDFDHHGPLEWTPDGEAVLVSSNRHAGWELETFERDLFRVSRDDGSLTALTDEAGAETGARFSPDGAQIAFLKKANEPVPYENRRLVVMDASGANRRELLGDIDRSIEELRWVSDDALVVRYDERGERLLALVALDGEHLVLTRGLGGTSLGRPYVSGSFSASAGGVVAFTQGSAQRPADVVVLDSNGFRQLTRLNEDLLGGITLGEVHELTYTSAHDGLEIQGWYVTPPGFDPEERYPLVLEIHGGPHSAYGPHFSAEIQLYAAAGYVVFYDNHRGSASYGEEFALKLQYKYASPEDAQDHLSGVDAMVALGFVDPDELFVTGGSAGGIATAYLVGLTDRFRAAVAAKPVINWISKTLTGDIYVYQIRHQFPGPPWEHLEHYWRRSPLSLVGNVSTPTMILTGEEDYRTPISESEQFYQALKLRGVDSALVRLPESSHGIASRPSRMIAKTDHVLAWFARYRGDGENGR